MIKRIMALTLAVLILLALAGCGANKDGIIEVVKNKKLSTLNATTYLAFSHVGSDFETKYVDYDGDKEKYQGGYWVWSEGTLTINVSNATERKIEFKNCKIKVEVGTQKYGKKTLEIELDEHGNGSASCPIVSAQIPSRASGTPNYVAPLENTLSYTVESAEGEMKIHIKADADGNIITESAETAE